MKQALHLFTTGLLPVLAALSCTVPESPVPNGGTGKDPGSDDRIVFGVKAAEAEGASTKAAAEGMTLELVHRPMELSFLPSKVEAVTALPSFEVLCTTGTLGAETFRWKAGFTERGGCYTGDQYWPIEDPSYHFYASNAPLTFDPDGTYITAYNDCDAVGAFLESPRYKDRNDLAFSHLFARLGRFTVTAEEGKTLSDVDVRLTPRSGGRYDLRNGTWSRMTTEDPVCVSPSGEGSRENDLYLVPGRYTLTASWTVWKRGFPTRKEGFTADIELPAGRVTDVSTVLGGRIEYPQLTLECLESGTIYWKGYVTRSIEYSKDEGDSWTTVTSSSGTGTPIPVTAGDVLLLRGYTDHVANLPVFDIPVRCYLYGDITSLVNGTGGLESMDTSLARLFEDCTGIRNHPTKELVLDCTTLVRNTCYHHMFDGCTGLTRAPELPATSLSIQCYAYMFSDCTSLVQAPEILPAPVLRNICYDSMFDGCSSLRQAPRLPATSLADGCYEAMFARCILLEEAPDLPATLIPIFAYNNMFDGCTSLRRIRCMALTRQDWNTNLGENQYTYFWTRNVPPGGHFVKNSSCSWWTTGPDGIPEGWTVSEESL